MTSDRDLAMRIAELGSEFWAWRLDEQPRTSDDIPRLTRRAGWKPAWSAADVVAHRAAVTAFDARWADLPVPSRGGDATARALLVDHALVGSAIARARFELDGTRLWATHPGFYVDHCLGVYFDELLALPPFDDARAARIAEALERTPEVLGWADENLAEGLVAEFAGLTVRALADVETALAASVAALLPHLGDAGPDAADRVAAAAEVAGAALGAFRDALAARLPTAAAWVPVGADGIAEFLRTIALTPLTAPTMLTFGARELARAEALSILEANIAPESRAPLLPDIAAQVERERLDELEVRAFYESRGILSQPDTLGHYRVAALPGYLAPLRWLGVTDDLTDEHRVDLDAVSYMPDPVEGLSYFYDANARDPRAGIIHEGAHYQQLALSWRHPNPLRRRYYDSGPNEGIAFYNEELMLRSGLFADAPGTRAAVHSFLRLRALRVLVDIGLATGVHSIDEAGELMAERIPMDLETAAHEAAYYAATPMIAGTYQIGKTQIEAFLADARRVQGDAFDLQAFHDFLWLNGNVPIALQRYELLGLDDELDLIRL